MNRRATTALAVTAAFVLTSTGMAYAHAGTASPLDEHGALEVCDTALCDETGAEVQLRGMSTHGLQWYGDCVNDAALDALAGDWNADVIRASMYIQEGGYETDPEGFTEQMNTIIEQATQRGLYVIIDWHMLSPGDPNANLELAEEFFTTMSQTHADADNVLYEVANEPNGVSWEEIKSYHEQILPSIRDNDPDGVVLLGTRGWSSLGQSEGSDESEVIDNPVDADNIMYTFHFYAATHGQDYLDTLDRASDALPMFVTEFGTQESSGDGENDFESSQRYLDLMADKNISWVNWNFSDDERSGAVFNEGTCPDGPFDTTNVKPAGQWIHEQLNGDV